MQFVAIDFETANEDRGSACAIGLALVRDGQVESIESYLIRPKSMEFSAFNTAIHGITEDDVEREPEFPEIWSKVYPRVAGNVVAAHSASFDIGVLRAVHTIYGIPLPDVSYLCTMITARRVWPRLPSYGLASLGRHIGHQFEHHRAGEDAGAAAAVAIAAARHRNMSDLRELASSVEVSIGRVFDGGYEPCRAQRNRTKLSDLAPQHGEADSDHPLFGMTVVFTGALDAMQRADAAQLVVNRGGVCSDGVTKETNFLVLGNRDYAFFQEGGRTGKLKKAEAIIEKGGELEIISEAEFFRLVM
jgi:DNA polymerase III subunit epsilon